jgi:ankyrin repeat protein
MITERADASARWLSPRKEASADQLRGLSFCIVYGKLLDMLKFRLLAVFAVVLTLLGTAAFAQNLSDRFYQSIRNDDLATLRVLVKDNGANVKDPRGQTPLMFAAAFGSLEAMKLLISSGADAKAESEAGVTALHWCAGDVAKVRLLLDQGAQVNKASRLGRTPLLVAAETSGALETVRLLLQKGADVNVADSLGFTPLIAAAYVDNIAVAKLLIEKTASLNAKTSAGQTGTALMGVASNGNLELTRLLLAHHADLNAVSADDSGKVKNGPVAFGRLTALHFAAASASPEVVRLLLDAGAPVDPRDVRGMTPLMVAVSTDRPNVDIVKTLLAKGADASIRSSIGESTVDWARKFNNPAILAMLKLEAVKVDGPAAALKMAGAKALTPEEAVERSLPLLQRASATVFTAGGCVACHAQPVASMAIEAARVRGWRVDDAVSKSVAEESERVRKSLSASMQLLLQGRQLGGTPDSHLYESMMMAAAREPSDPSTDGLVHFLLAKQQPAGNWAGFGSRAPIQDGDFSRTAMAIQTLTVYGMAGRKAEIAERVGRAADWLAKHAPLSTQERIMQILGLKWAGAQAGLRETRTKELIALQRPDGGWAQTPYLASDAYATGQVLYMLRETGFSSVDDPAFRRGVQFLLRTQKEDGSWYVESRAMKIQPYFQSGFPYDHDQWISASATAWASMALSFTETEKPAVARVDIAK